MNFDSTGWKDWNLDAGSESPGWNDTRDVLPGVWKYCRDRKPGDEHWKYCWMAAEVLDSKSVGRVEATSLTVIDSRQQKYWRISRRYSEGKIGIIVEVLPNCWQYDWRIFKVDGSVKMATYPFKLAVYHIMKFIAYDTEFHHRIWSEDWAEAKGKAGIIGTSFSSSLFSFGNKFSPFTGTP